MSGSRRDFLAVTALGVLGAAVGCKKDGETQSTTASSSSGGELPPGAPSAFATGTAVGPDVSAATFAEAEKLMRIDMGAKELQEAASSWRVAMAPLYERRMGPKKVEIEDTMAPASVWVPLLLENGSGPTREKFVRSGNDAGKLPSDEREIAFAPVTKLSRWIEKKQITSERLTNIYLGRLEKFNKTLRCAITITKDLALDQARAADREIAAGRYRGPLHGIPWGAKDLLDTAGIKTTYGAEPFQDRIPGHDATVVQRLHEAGAVLVAKLSMGALALNDIWFGGQTMNPWLLEEGSSGSSAGPGSATAAGLVGFSIGSETGGSIVSPSMRCGVTGLRPTYGRVPRTGAMTLCWSLDKLGPMTRGVEDSLLVLKAITGPDNYDVASVASKLDFDSAVSVQGLRVGYIPAWLKGNGATDVDRGALETARKLGMRLMEVALPDWPYDSLNLILFAEAAAAFEELTSSGKVDLMKMQVADAWPNIFRQARFLSAVDYVQADRLRRKVALEMSRVMEEVDVLMVPSLRDEMLVISNNTGHPSLTLRAGFIDVSEARSDWAPDPNHPLPKFSPPRKVPHGVTLIGRMYEEGTLGRVGMALERSFGVAGATPNGF